jgi:hypothetical protein
VDVTVYVPLVLAIVVAAVLPSVTRLLPPRTAVQVLTAGSVIAAAGWVLALGILVFTALGRVPAVANEGHWSATVWRQDDPVGLWAADLAGAFLAVSVAVFIRDMVREARSRRYVRRLSAGLPSGERVVFVDDDAPHAYAVGGRHPHIVVSRGLMRTLSGPERRAVLAHETAHVNHHHHRYLLAVRLSAALYPMLRPSVPVAVLAVERWADEETAASVGDRTLVARALLRAALAGAEHGRMPRGVLAHTTGDVSRRVRALMAEPPRQRRSITVVTAALLVATVAAPGIAANNLDNHLDQAQSAAHAPAGPAHHRHI